MALTSYRRKPAIGALTGRATAPGRRGRPRIYANEAKAAMLDPGAIGEALRQAAGPVHGRVHQGTGKERGAAASPSGKTAPWKDQPCHHPLTARDTPAARGAAEVSSSRS